MNTIVKPGRWNGLVVGNTSKHRGSHAAVLREDGTPLCIVGPAKSPQAQADSRMLADLWNKAQQANVSIASLN
jgi:hypothetical protein